MKIKATIQCCALIWGGALPVFAYADTAAEEFIRQQQRQEQLQKQLQPEASVRLDESVVKSKEPLVLIQDETPCFEINEVVLKGDEAGRFQFALRSALHQLKFKSGMCLGAQGVNQIMTVAQNKIISRGYTTTRVLAAPQDLKNGKLVLTVIPGRVRDIRFDETNSEQTHVERIKASHNALPMKSGDILNLRKIEQGLENLKRVPTAEADIQIVPADAPNESDIVIKWAQRQVPVRVSLSVDDSGSDSTGKYQGSATVSLDNPLGLSDLFYFTYNHDLGGKDSYTDMDGREANSGTYGYNVHYSIPFKNWQFAINASENKYRQAVAGTSQVYTYRGTNETLDANLSRLLYRDAHRKTSASVGVWSRKSRNFIDDAEIEVQRRATAGWKASLDHKEYVGDAIINANVTYKRGTGGRDALAAPEELFGEGTHRMKIITADLGVAYPFKLGKQNFSYSGSARAQWNKTPLVANDQFSIGSRYTVRGFDEKMTLMAERGWFVRNEVSWSYLPAHQVYLGADVGHVSGPSAKYLLGQTLAGAAIGLRGQFKVGGQLYYDVYAGSPLKKPDNFKTDDVNAGFSVSYSF